MTPAAGDRERGGGSGAFENPAAARGRANAACIALLAEEFRVPKAAVELNPAARARRKRVEIRGDPVQLGERLHALARTSRVG